LGFGNDPRRGGRQDPCQQDHASSHGCSSVVVKSRHRAATQRRILVIAHSAAAWTKTPKRPRGSSTSRIQTTRIQIRPRNPSCSSQCSQACSLVRRVKPCRLSKSYRLQGW
jgi:hypothetical protein